MTPHLLALPSPDLGRLGCIEPRDLVLAWLGTMAARSASPATIARGLRRWGLTAQDAVRGPLDELAKAGLAEVSAGRWRLTPQGAREADARFGHKQGREGSAGAWPAVAERYFTAQALGLDPHAPATADYLRDARNLYACALAVLFALADPATQPKLGAMRGALTWRICAARCPDLLPAEMPDALSGPSDAVARALYTGFCGVPGTKLEQATPALLRRVLPGPLASGTGGLRRGLVRAALRTGEARNGSSKHEVSDMQTVQPAAAPAAQADVAEDFAEAVAALARRLKTPKARGGTFTGGQVAIAQLYDAFAADTRTPMTLDAFKARLWASVRAGADFHLTRLDIPDLMEEDLRKRSATPTRAGDVVHFIVVD